MIHWFRRINRKFMSYYFIALFFVLWEIAPKVGWANPRFVPPLSKVLLEGWKLIKNGDLFIHISISLQRTFLGFLLATAVALPMGFILGGWLPRVAKFLKPLMNLFAQINSMTLFPLFLLLFGLGEGGKISIIFWASFWPVLFTTLAGVQQVDPILIKCARSMGTNGVTVFLKVVLPGAALQIFTGIRTGVTMAFMMLIGAEVMGANMGLGWLVHNSEANWLIPRLYTGLLTIAVIGLIINYTLEWLESSIITWREAAPDKNL